jgi:hypothetical protein
MGSQGNKVHTTMMHKIVISLGLFTALSVPALAQQPPFPQTLPPNTVVGRISPVSGPATAVPLATLAAAMGGGSGGTPAGLDQQIQYNNAGFFGGLTNPQVTARIQPFTSVLSGAVPASGGGTTNFLRADGVFAAPPGSGGGSVASPTSVIGPVVVNGVLATAMRSDAAPPLQKFTQAGTGAVPYDVWSKLGQTYSVKDFGAVGNGTTDDTIAIQNAINAVIAAGGGELYFPAANSGQCYHTTSTLTIDTSAITPFALGRIHLVGTGPSRSCIENSTTAGVIIDYIGRLATPGAYFSMEHMRLQSNAIVVGSIGLRTRTEVAFLVLRDVLISGFDTGFDATDTEQIAIYDSFFQDGNVGIRAHPATSGTEPNSWTIVNSAAGSNSIWGAFIEHASAFTWVGGSIQYNSSIGAGAGGGINLNNMVGYATALFDGMIFEGNGGVADFAASNTTIGGTANVTFNNVAWTRTTAGFATNNINISGTQPNTNYNLINNHFLAGVGYVASVARPAIANTNGNTKIAIDGLTTFWSSVEAPGEYVQYFGATGMGNGTLVLWGVTSGAIDFRVQAAAGTYNFNLPTSAGTAGQALLSGGGGSSPMTFGTLPGSGGGTGLATAVVGDMIYASATAPTWARLADVAVGSVLASGGTGTAPAWSNTPAISGSLLVGASSTLVTSVFTVHKSTDRNFFIDTATNGVAGIAFGSVNDANAAFTPFQVNALFTEFGGTGHITTREPNPPVVTLCGTGSVDATSTDTAGKVTATGATSCVVNFIVPYTSTPICTVTDGTTAAALKAVPTTGLLTVSGLTSNDVFYYHCFGVAGG